MRRESKPPVLLGVIGTVVLLAIAYGAFTKRVPFLEGYRLQGVFQSSVGLRPGSPIRIAGVDVGKVVAFDRGPGATRIVEFEFQDRGRPIHRDAVMRIRPRLFLEGGFYVDLDPGSPSAPELDDGATVPLPQTKIPVQFDQVLSVFDTAARASLRTVVGELDAALDDGGAEAAAAAQQPLAPALRDTAIVAQAARGTRPDNLSRLVTGASRVTTTLAQNRAELAGLLAGLRTTTQALGDEAAGLRGTIRGLDDVLAVAPRSLRTVVDAAPSTEALFADLRPGLRVAPRVLPDVNRLLEQLRLGSRDPELPSLLRTLRPTVNALPTLADRLGSLFPLVTPVTDCVRDQALPVLNARLDDRELSSGQPVWQELASALAALPGASGSFDGNGQYVRYAGGIGDQTVSTGRIPGLSEVLQGTVSEPLVGVRPTPLPAGTKPPFRPDAACGAQAPPNLDSRTSGTPAGLSPAGRSRRVQVTRRQLRTAFERENLLDRLEPLGPPGSER